MYLLIRAVSLAGQPLTQAIAAYFDERGGTIGRSDTNTLALPDPERRISRLQAEVSRAGDGWRILNVGNANPIWHNSRPLPPGEAVQLNEGDELQIGAYALLASYSQNDEMARTITRGRMAIDSRAVIAGSGMEPRTDAKRQANVQVGAPVMTPMPVITPTPAAPENRPQAATPAPAPASAQASAAPAMPATPAPAANPFADLLGDLGRGASAGTAPLPAGAAASASPFDDLLGFGGKAAPLAPTPPQAAMPSAQAASPVSSQASAASPFADLFSASPAPATPSAPAPASVTRLPDDFDPFADLLSEPKAKAGASGSSAAPAAWDLPAAQPAPAAASPFDLSSGGSSLPGDLDLLGAVTPAGSQSIDQVFGLAGKPSSADPLADFLSKTAPPAPAEAPVGAPSSVDPLALLSSRENIVDEGAGQVAEPTAPLPDDVPEIQAAMVLPEAMAPGRHALELEPPTVVGGFMPPPARPRPAEPMSASFSFVRPKHAEAPAPIEASVPPAAPEPVPVAAAVRVAPMPAEAQDASQALWAAFCEGAGVRIDLPQGLNPEMMRILGQLLRTSVDGTVKLVAARAATKVEMRAEVTVIQSRHNNPLKFSPDALSALEQLLQPPMRGFMAGPEAMADAMDDLLGHTIGTMVGMRAALEGVLKRFEPGQLESKLSGHSMLDSVLPMNRRAKLWDLYLQHFETVRNEAQDDFHNLFGRAFLQAYEDQLDRLHAERHAAAVRARGTQ